ncbi:MAG: prolipoprotein diacylglyceryl transferase [Spirochaetales bacterium]|nr:prolipoprotein diacylglyceryl transferase [Spirochaetales bacterium]
MLAYINYPAWINPEVIPGLPVRWYSLMYVVAFSIAYYLMMKQLKAKKNEADQEVILNCFFWGIVGLLIGARVLATTVYDPSHFYIRRPWLIFWPFRDGHFTGLQGMSYHGGVIGAVVATIIYSKKNKIDWFEFADIAVAGIPLGYTFGRLGNFINGELWGRVTTKPWGMVFPHAERFNVSLGWVQSVASEIGMKLSSSGVVNLPRHPSQLYEAFFEGIVLWLFIWFFAKNKKKFHGTVISCYLIGYGLVRFVIEYFREPDSDMGFVFQFGGEQDTLALFHSFLNFSTGQILCAIMIVGGLCLYFVRRFQTGNSFPQEPSKAVDESAVKQKNSIRKQRKKVKK